MESRIWGGIAVLIVFGGVLVPAVEAGEPVCASVSSGDSILGVQDSCMASDSSANDRVSIGVMEFIPPEFAQTIGFLKNRNVFLGCSTGQTWKVKISVVDGSMAFQEGWRDYVSNLSCGELVTFKYIGGSFFKAKVYATSACNRVNISKNNTDSSPCHRGYASKKENIDDGGKRPYPTLSIHDETYFSGSKRTSEANGPSLKKPREMESTSPMLSGTDHVLEEAGYHTASKEPLNHMLYTTNCSTNQEDGIKRKRGRPRKTEIGRPVNVKSFTKLKEYKAKKTKKVAHVSKRLNEAWRKHRETVDDSLSKTHSAFQNYYEVGMCNLKEPEEAPADFLVTKDGICHIFERSLHLPIKSVVTRNKSCTNQNGKVMASHEEKHRNPPKNGTSMSLICRVKGLPLVHNNARFSVTLPTLSSWLELGGRLQSHLGRVKMNRKVIILQDPSMNMWPVLYYEKSKFVGFIRGWEDFATANDLREGDVCEFVHVQGTEDMFQVQVSR